MTHPAITPHVHLHNGPGIAAPRTWKFEDNSTAIYPRLPNGKSCRVVIIRRTLTSSGGTTIKVCKNAGKWSYSIHYAYQDKVTRMTKAKWILEVTRMGGHGALEQLLALA